MKKFFRKPYRYAAVFSGILAACITLTLLDAYVFPKSYAVVPDDSGGYSTNQTFATKSTETATLATEPVTTEIKTGSISTDIDTDTGTGSTESASSTTTAIATTAAKTTASANADFPKVYSDNDIQITISKIHEYNTDIYIADVKLSSLEYLKTAFAKNTYGKGVTQTTTKMSAAHNALFAVSGDYYGFDNAGTVLRNGTLYRDTAGYYSSLSINYDGTFSFLPTGADYANSWQVLNFGPILIENGKICVEKAINGNKKDISGANPRCAVGIIEPLHYVFVVADGRTTASKGLKIYDLAEVFANLGATAAFNLDGGGSATMVFNGKLVNKPTTDGSKIAERAISDSIYIGYE
ncbi:MAG: phosphodiester glycosidase family protein [Oscillospiraceae bacterium]|jgi:exopolysaccharide biosynthesis protein|nr:phosphodiester glycosidase family protein [Oscillospiraceae bacterium]